MYDTGVTYQSIDPLNNTTTYAYSSTYVGAFPTAITNALSQITANAYDFNTGLLTSTTDPNLQPTTYTYDPESWRETKVVYPDGGQTSFCYSDTASEGCSSGTPYQVNISKKITSSLALAETLIVDGFGRNTETELTSDPSGIDYTAKTYDGDSREASVTNPYRATSDTTYGVTQYQYDGLGRTLLITKPDNSTIHTAYCGPTTLVTDEAGHWRRSTVDGLGRLIEVDEPNSTTATVNSNGCPGTSEPIWVTTYGYDAIGDLVGVVQGGSRNRSFVFDSLKRLTISTNPERYLHLRFRQQRPHQERRPQHHHNLHVGWPESHEDTHLFQRRSHRDLHLRPDHLCRCHDLLQRWPPDHHDGREWLGKVGLR